ncbi:class I SAM-dependent methyltransferase [Candidatus Woesearchaeota archaeon]|nr:class I SAM-dependent methyltransferase [Candidatus Woesearchaeota archaeon]
MEQVVQQAADKSQPENSQPSAQSSLNPQQFAQAAGIPQAPIIPPDMEAVRCDLCGQDNYLVIYKGALKADEGCSAETYKSSGNKPTEDTIVKCNSCSLIYVNPRLKGEKIVEGYSEGTDENFVSQVKGRESTFLKGIQFIERFTKPGKILDIGTASASFLHVAKKRGWQVYGVEPNKWLCGWAHRNYGLYVQPGTIDSLNYPDGFFDVITLWDVLEHVPNPTWVLERCHRLLKPGGFLYVNYPDYESYASRVMKSKWIFLLSVHLYYFTRTTIDKMLQKTGFQTLKFRTHWQTLTLGYLVYRMQPYSKLLYRLGNAVVTLLHMKNLPFKYQLGQTGVIARKK